MTYSIILLCSLPREGGEGDSKRERDRARRRGTVRERSIERAEWRGIERDREIKRK